MPDVRVPGFLGRVLADHDDPVGTCFHVAPGVVVTACHVLAEIDAARVDARVLLDPLAGGAAFWATVARLDALHDLAVLSAEEPGFAEVCGPLAATDGVALREPVRVTGHPLVYEPGHAYRFLDALGTWAGGSVRDGEVGLGRLISDQVLKGMSGAPVLRESDGAVLGVASGRYNTPDGWLAGTVWVARTEDLAPLLEGLADVDLASGLATGVFTPGGDGAPSAGDQAVVLDAYLRWVVATHRDARALIAGYPVDAPLAQMPWTGSVHSDGSTRYGRNQEVDYLRTRVPDASDEDCAQARVEALAGRPLPTYVGPAAHPDRVDPSAPAGEASEPAAALVERTWRCVILGDPGSGKTTLVRRFALEHAERGLARDASVWRLPVLCRAADLVPALESGAGGVHAPALTAVAVGWSAPSRPAAPADPVSGDRIPAAALADLARHAAAQGRLLLIVDGLDEVATFEERGRLVERLNALVAAEGQRFDEPGRVRGNQIFVTSRLIGYHATPMAEVVRQVVLERISAGETLATGRFWLAHHARATGRGPVAAAAARGQLDRVLGPGGDENARALAGLATNPYLLVSLVSAVASGAWARRGPRAHPVARGDLYEFMIGDAVARGEARFPGVAGQLLLDLHAALGYLIHRTSPTGILPPAALEARAGEALALQGAARAAGTGPADALRYVKELGLLADRGQQLYGFLHLTLEEYLAGRWLVRAGDAAETAARIGPHLGDPRWVEPIRLGLGYLSRADGPRFDAVLTLLLTGPGGEHAIGLLAAGLIELSGVRPAHLEAAVEAVLELETQRLTRGDDQATAARLLLPLLAAPVLADAARDGAAGPERAADLVGRAVAQAVESGSQWRLAAAARVAQALRLHDPRVVEALMRAQFRDGPGYGWAVVRALQAMCVLADESLRGVEPGANKSAADVLAGLDEPTREQLALVELVAGSVAGIALPSRAPIPGALVPMGAGLDEHLLARLATGPVALVRLVLCLYGGTVFLDWWRWDAERTRLKSVLEVTDTPHATARAAAVYLDTVVTPALSGPSTGIGSAKDLTVLWPSHITVDSPLTGRLLTWLGAGGGPETPEVIAERLRVLALDPGQDPELRGDAAAGLIALGTRTAADALAAVHPALPGAAATRLAWRLERARLLLGDEVPHFNLGAMLTSFYWTEYDATWGDISEAYLAMLQAIRRLEHEGLPAGGGFVWYATIQEALVTLLCASLNLDDHLYSVAVILDTTGQSLMRHGPENLAEVLATAHLAAVAHEGRTTSWELDSLAPREAPVTAEALTALLGLAPRLTFVRCWMLDRLIPLLTTREDLVEAACLALRERHEDPASVLRTLRRLGAAAPALTPLTALAEADLDDPALLTLLEQAAAEVQLPYPRARATAHLAALRGGGADRAGLLRAADAVTGPHERLRFLELAVTLGVLSWDQDVTGRARAAIAAMDTSFDAALAVTRLARAVSPRDFHRLRGQLTEIADQEPTERLRLRTALGAHATVADPLLRFDPHMTTLDMHRETNLGGWRSWAALTGAALYADALTVLRAAEQQEDPEAEGGELWSALADPARRRAAVRSLRHRSPRRVDLDAPACASITRMLRAGDTDLVADVLTVARQRRPLAEVAGWRAAADPRVADLATLLVIEAGDFDESAVDALPRLLMDEDDLVRIRAARAIAVLSRGNSGRRLHHASRLGPATLAALTRLTARDQPPRLSTDLWWGLTDVVHDDIPTLRAALDLLAGQDEERALLLFSVRQITAPALLEFARLTLELPAPGQVAVLDALQGLADNPRRAGLVGAMRVTAPLRELIDTATSDDVQARAWSVLGQTDTPTAGLLREFTRRAADAIGAVHLTGATLGAVEGLGHLLQRAPAPQPTADTAGAPTAEARAAAVRVLRTLVTAPDTALSYLAATALYRAEDHAHLAGELAAGRADALVLLHGLIGCLNARMLIGPAYYQDVARICRFVRQPPGLAGRDAEEHTHRLLGALLARAAEDLRAARGQAAGRLRRTRPRHLPSRSSQISVLAELAAIQPAAIRVAAQRHPDLPASLAEATGSDDWLLRQHAARLLILLGCGDASATRALLDTALDTDTVRQAVLADAVWFDAITPEGFDLLLSAAEDRSPARSYLAVQLLAVLLARSTLHDAEHMAALGAIQRATTAPGADQPLLAEHDGEIRNVGTVADAGRRILTELAAGGPPVAEAFGSPQFRVRIPAERGEPLELVLPRHPTRAQWPAVVENQSTYYQTFRQRYDVGSVAAALNAAAQATAPPGIPLDELFAQARAASCAEEGSPDAVPSA